MPAALFILLGLVLFGCAEQPLTVPNSSAVDSGISNAKQFNDVAEVHGQAVSGDLERIDAKTAVLKKYW